MIRTLRDAARLVVLTLSLLWTMLLCGQSQAVPTVWSGLTVSFAKPDFSDWTLPENQDQISPSVALTRGDLAGIFNIEQESAFQGPGSSGSPSPVGTEWATALLGENVGDQITASNWANLTFTPWQQAYGNGVGHVIVGEPAVLHLIEEDVYLDIMFTDWTVSSNNGGGFSYFRADGDLPDPTPDPTGDFNGNGVVDAADYTNWRDTLGATVTPGDGADGDESGTIDAGDYTFWKARFGETVPGAASGTTVFASASAVPEPSTLVGLITGLIASTSMGAWRRHQAHHPITRDPKAGN